MSKSLSIKTGDLSVTGRHYDTVSGKDKLIQDLRCLMIERVGNDPATPDFGSQFDTDTYIGQVYTDVLAAEARQEVQDLLEGYQAAQLQKIKDETIAYNGLNTFSDGEVIQSIDSIASVTTGTSLLIRVILTTMSSEQIKIDVPLDTFTYG
jgi:phage baseplate assembly protein W